MHRAKWSSEGKVWICSKTCGECSVRHIKENEIFEASKHFLGEDYNGKVVEYIDKIYISNEEAKFIFKDGTVKIWQRK